MLTVRSELFFITEAVAYKHDLTSNVRIFYVDYLRKYLTHTYTPFIGSQ